MPEFVNTVENMLSHTEREIFQAKNRIRELRATMHYKGNDPKESEKHIQINLEKLASLRRKNHDLLTQYLAR